MNKITRKSIRANAREEAEGYSISEQDKIRRKHQQKRHNNKDQAEALSYPKK